MCPVCWDHTRPPALELPAAGCIYRPVLLHEQRQRAEHLASIVPHTYGVHVLQHITDSAYMTMALSNRSMQRY